MQVIEVNGIDTESAEGSIVNVRGIQAISG